MSRIHSAIHVLAGLFCALLFALKPGLAVMLVAGFFAYEMWQALRIADSGWRDWREALTGMFIGAVVMLTLEYCGVPSTLTEGWPWQ